MIKTAIIVLLGCAVGALLVACGLYQRDVLALKTTVRVQDSSLIELRVTVKDQNRFIESAKTAIQNQAIQLQHYAAQGNLPAATR